MRQAPSDTPASMSRPVATNDAPDTATATLIEVLREQLQQAQQEKARLLSLLESEQEARRNLEQKLLLPPPRHTRPVVLLIVLALTLVALVITRWAAGAVGNARNAMEGKASGATGLSRGRCGSPPGAARLAGCASAGQPGGSKPAPSPVERPAPVVISAGPHERRVGPRPCRTVERVSRGRFSLRAVPGDVLNVGGHCQSGSSSSKPAATGAGVALARGWRCGDSRCGSP
jgi:hypothetical protein